MKRNKGFSLTECVIAVCIVMLISFALVTTCLLSISTTNKSNAIQIINNETLNLVKIVKGIEIENGGEYAPKSLQDAILSFYGKHIDLSENELNKKQSIFFSDSGQVSASGSIELKVMFWRKNEYI